MALVGALVLPASRLPMAASTAVDSTLALAPEARPRLIALFHVSIYPPVLIRF
jgi:hypothetical protein